MSDDQGDEEGSTLNLIGNTTITCSPGGRIRIRNASLNINIMGPLTVLNPQGLASVLASAVQGASVSVGLGGGSSGVASGSLVVPSVSVGLEGVSVPVGLGRGSSGVASGSLVVPSVSVGLEGVSVPVGLGRGSSGVASGSVVPSVSVGLGDGGFPVGVPSGSSGSLRIPSGSLGALGVDLDLDGGVVSSHGASGSGGFQALEGEFHPGWPDPRVHSDVQAPAPVQVQAPAPVQVQAPAPVQVQAPAPVQAQALDPTTAGIRDAAYIRKLSESEVLYLLRRNTLPITNPKAMRPTSGVFTYPAEQYNRFRDGHEYHDHNGYYQPQSPELKYHISFASADNMPRMTVTRRRYRLADGSSPVFVCHYLLEDDDAADLAVLEPLVPL